MQENYLIFGIVALIVIVLVALFIIMVNLQKTVVVTHPSKEKKEAEAAKEKATIEAMIDIASKRRSSKTDLMNAILKVVQDCPFPAKQNGTAPKLSKVYLNFVLLIASHPQSDAQMIAFMSQRIKDANPEYKQEIDIYENEGINQRGNRI